MGNGQGGKGSLGKRLKRSLSERTEDDSGCERQNVKHDGGKGGKFYS